MSYILKQKLRKLKNEVHQHGLSNYRATTDQLERLIDLIIEVSDESPDPRLFNPDGHY